MKKLLGFLALVLCFNVSENQAQILPNGGFDTWFDKDYYYKPDTFSTSNLWVYSESQNINVERTTDCHSGTYAARMETVFMYEDTMPGGIMIGDFMQSDMGGIPYPDRPDSLRGYVKYDLIDDDTAVITGLFMNQGNLIGVVVYQMIGTQDDYMAFSVPVWWFDNTDPDTLYFRAMSSGSEIVPGPGSVLYVDGLEFSGDVDPIPNGDLEDWTMLSSEEPEDWTTVNIFSLFGGELSATKTPDSFEGDYALKLKTVVLMGEDTMGYITNGYIDDDGPAGGLKVYQNPEILTGYYKYDPIASDTALGALNTFIWDASGDSNMHIEEGRCIFEPADDWTYFEIMLTYDDWPGIDTLNVTFASSNFENPATVEVGSILQLDALEVSYYPVHIDEYPEYAFAPVLYPNPCTDYVSIEVFTDINREGLLEIFSLPGQKIYQKKVKIKHGNQSFKINLNNLESGIYIYKFKNGPKEFQGKIIKKE